MSDTGDESISFDAATTKAENELCAYFDSMVQRLRRVVEESSQMHGAAPSVLRDVKGSAATSAKCELGSVSVPRRYANRQTRMYYVLATADATTMKSLLRRSMDTTALGSEGMKEYDRRVDAIVDLGERAPVPSGR